MSTYSDYIAYFEQLARDFVGHTDTEKHFFHTGLEEFLNGLTTSVNYPALLLDKYDFTYQDNGADSFVKTRTIAFLIIDNTKDTEDYDRINDIYSESERIIDSIIKQIRKDIHYPKSDFLKYANLNNIQVSPIENYADGNYGFFVTMEIYTIVSTL